MNDQTVKNDKIDEVTKQLVDIGTLWARHGLAMGRSALEASAKTLHATAKLLGDVADSLDGEKHEEAKPTSA